MTDDRTFVIVGASQAGGWVANSLRSEGFEGKIILIGEEEHIPYERPPLSKEALLGDVTVDSTHFWKKQTLEESKIELRLGTRVSSIDRKAKKVITEFSILYCKNAALSSGLLPFIANWTASIVLYSTIGSPTLLKE